MPLFNRLTPREQVGTASPVRLDRLAGKVLGGGAQVAGAADEAKRERDRVFQEGFRAGESAARALAERERIRLESVLDAHEREMGRLNETLARAVLGLAVDLARHVTRAHVEVKEDAVIPVIQEALALIREDNAPARLVLAPPDAACAERAIGAELSLRGCRIVPDPKMAAGECRLESQHAQVDATLATRWKKALAPLGETRDWLD